MSTTRDVLFSMLLPAFLLFWATILIFVSFNMEDKVIFWVQRGLAFFLLIAAFGVFYVNTLS